MSRVQATFASVSAGSSQTDGRSRFQPGSRWGTAVSVARIRVTAPWKCSNRIPDIGDGIGPEPLDRDVDQGVRQAVGEARQPVVERAGREAVVEDPVHVRIGHLADLDDERRAPADERREVALRLLRRRPSGRRSSPQASSPSRRARRRARRTPPARPARRRRRPGRSAAGPWLRRSGGRSVRP